MSLLILGGTADGRKLADQLHHLQIPIVYSVAGLVRAPTIDCKVVIGGFSQFGGLGAFIKRHEIRAILDATHPYAQIMSDTAVRVARKMNIPCWRFDRKPWQQEAGDNWQLFRSWQTLFASLSSFKSVFLTCGQLNQLQIDGFINYSSQTQLLRTAVKPQATLPQSMTWLKAIGPFELQDEIETMQTYNIDALVSKNSGGESTQAKLVAAREMEIPVYLLERPQLTSADKCFNTYNSCITEIKNHFQR